MRSKEELFSLLNNIAEAQGALPNGDIKVSKKLFAEYISHVTTRPANEWEYYQFGRMRVYPIDDKRGIRSNSKHSSLP